MRFAQFILVGTALIAHRPFVLGQTLRAEGSAAYQVFERDGTIASEWTRRFAVSVRGNSWRIRIDPVPGKQLQVDYWGDGTNLVKKQTGEPLRGAEAETDKRLRAENPAYTGYAQETFNLYLGRVPAFGGDLVFPVWLVFASGPYFNTLTNNMAPNILAMGFHPVASRVNSIGFSLRRKAEGRLLAIEEIIWRDPGYSVKEDGLRIPNKPPLDQGYVRARFEVRKWAQDRTTEYPALSVLEGYAPKRDSPTNEVWRTMRVTIQTERFETETSSDPVSRPGISAGIMAAVYDHRFATVLGTPATYCSTNDLLEPNDPRLLQFKAQAEMFDLRRPKRPGESRKLLY